MEKQAREGQTRMHSRKMKRNSQRHAARRRTSLSRKAQERHKRGSDTPQGGRGGVQKKPAGEVVKDTGVRTHTQQVEEEEGRPDAHDACCRRDILQHRVHQNDGLALALSFIHLTHHTSALHTLNQ